MSLLEQTSERAPPPSLRSYQIKALDDLREYLRRGGKRMAMTAPTGAGKTKLAATIASEAMRKGKKMAFVVPAISLIDQTVEMFADEGVDDVGVIQANHIMTDWAKPIQVCSIQTLRSRETFPQADIVVLDECHQLHKTHKDWLGEFKRENGVISYQGEWARVPFIGLSATPWARGMGKHFDALLTASTTKELIEAGYLSPFTVYAPSKPDLSEVRKLADDFHNGDLSAAMNKPKLVGDVVSTWKRLWNKDKTIVFAVDLAHARALADEFLGEGIRAEYQDAKTPLHQRAENRRMFHAGEMPVVCSVGTMIMGVDWDVRCLVWARPTMSEMLYVQGTGRGLRTAPGKDRLLILDHADNAMRLGFVDEIVHEHLDDGSPRKKSISAKPGPRMCKKCMALMEPATVICPECGHLAERKNRVMFLNGELVQVDIATLRPDAIEQTFTEDELRLLYAMMKRYAETHITAAGQPYSMGWVSNKFKERTGGWPPRDYKSLQSVEVSEELWRWIENEKRKWMRRQGGGWRR